MIQSVFPAHPAAPCWQERFLAMLPAIRTHARLAFRHLKPEAREDAAQEVVANALVALVRLVQLGKSDVAYPTVLGRYAVAQFQDGRRVGNRRNVRDVLSPYAQKRKRFDVERLDRFDKEDGQWVQAVVEDHRTPILEQVAFRCDFPAWLDTLPRRNRVSPNRWPSGKATRRSLGGRPSAQTRWPRTSQQDKAFGERGRTCFRVPQSTQVIIA
jgi:hypothetical protein